MKRPAILSDATERMTRRAKWSLLGLDLFASSKRNRVAVACIFLAWAPIALLAGFRGLESLRSFLTDYAAQSRLVVVIPLLILAEGPFRAALEGIARQFYADELIKTGDLPRFNSAFAFLKKEDSAATLVTMAVIVLASAISLAFLAKSVTLMAWCYESTGLAGISAAGLWYIFVGLSISLFFVLRWLWRQFVWLRFLILVSRLDLRLIPSHPDRSGGLGFIEMCIRRYVPFGFAIGTLFAGGIANRVAYLHRPLDSFRYTPVFVVVIVLCICCLPLCVFQSTLLRVRHLGIFEYGRLALDVGREFEKKWLYAEPQKPASVLGVQDFSAAIDLYSVVANVHEMKVVPLRVKSVTRLIIAALAPGIPLVFLFLPFDLVMRDALKLLT